MILDLETGKAGREMTTSRCFIPMERAAGMDLLAQL